MPSFTTPVYYALFFSFLSLFGTHTAQGKPASVHASENRMNLDTARSEGGQLLAYVREGDTERTRALHLAYSQNGEFIPLNNGKAILYPLVGSRKMGAPHIFKKGSDGFGLITS
ncbi:MAG TPA: hypothetical protein VK921_09660, partial [Anditalea sp.]|nr:hypothetical protein [Anditalea sp.]